MRRELAIEFSRATEAAALAGYKWLGRGDKNAADGAAVLAMRHVLNEINIRGEIVIGEYLTILERWSIDNRSCLQSIIQFTCHLSVLFKMVINFNECIMVARLARRRLELLTEHFIVQLLDSALIVRIEGRIKATPQLLDKFLSLRLLHLLSLSCQSFVFGSRCL